jgi:hypothetical protein
MINFFIIIIILFFINYKIIDKFNSIPNNDNIIENKNILNNFYTNNRKLL